jgi:hypothetical protein
VEDIAEGLRQTAAVVVMLIIMVVVVAPMQEIHLHGQDWVILI